MEQITWALTILVLVTWLAVGWSLARTPMPYPPAWGTWPRRLLWIALWLVALAAGSSGPRVWDGTRTDFPREATSENPAETSVREIRTPFAIERVSWSEDHEGRTLQTERRLFMRIPVGLLSFLALVAVLSTRSRAGRPRIPETGVSAMLLVVTLSGCASDTPGLSSSEEQRPAARVFAGGSWDTLAHVRADPSDTVLFVASAVTADEEGFWVLDGIARRIVRFDWDGRVRWRAGREGQGPGEFRTLQQAEPDDAGRLWVLDPGNARISALDADGELVAEVPIGDWSSAQLPHAFAVRGDGSRFHVMLWGAALRSAELRPAELDRAGEVVELGSSIAVPGAHGGMTLQGVIGRDRGSGDWVYALSMGDGMYRVRGTEAVGDRIPYVESVPFPGLVQEVTRDGAVTNTVTRLERPRFAALDVAVQEGTILVGFRGESEQSGRLVDRYDLNSGAYLTSILLPRAGRFGAWGDRFVIVANDPSPEVLALRWSERS